MTSSEDKEDQFNFRVLVQKFQKVADGVNNEGKVDLASFADAMSDFMKVFGALGSGFAFAFKDLNEKVDTLNAWAPIHGDAKTALAKDVETQNLPPNDKAVGGLGKVRPSTF